VVVGVIILGVGVAEDVVDASEETLLGCASGCGRGCGCGCD